MRILLAGPFGREMAEAARIAADSGARVDQAESATATLGRLRSATHTDLVLADLAIGIPALLRALRGERIATPVIACGIDPEPAEAAAAIAAGAQEFLPLPPDPELIAAILAAVAAEHDQVIARDPAMLATLRRAEQVAAAQASVLIAGESGTGKEVLARHLHRRSRRASSPFVALNCAAIPEQLLESELFGHEKGAFSGAAARRIGRFEAAQGGTLLLDEISEMDIRLQAKLLRAIQEREIDRLGGSAPVRVDVRILATTNRDLPREVTAGRFREDLYFRLNVICLRVPPLRERPADIPVLADHYARHYAGVNGLPARPLSPATHVHLVRHAWPGNVRELENAMHRAVLLSEGATIEPGAVELPIATTPPATALPTPQATTGVAALIGRRMDEVERDLILHTLGHTAGNRTHAATILGISIRALRNKLRDYAEAGLPVPPPGAGIGPAWPGAPA